MQEQLTVNTKIFDKIKSTVTQQDKFAFFSALIIACLTYGYAITNHIFNHDDWIGLSSTGIRDITPWFISLGRPINVIFAWLHGTYSLSLLIGLFSIICIALTSLFLIRIFAINSRFIIVCISGVIATNPTLISVFPYYFQTDFLFASVFLFTLAVYICRKRKLGFFIAYILCTVAITLYQPYIFYGFAICVLALIVNWFNGINLKDNFIIGIRYFLMFFLCIITYIIILIIISSYIPLTSYNSFNSDIKSRLNIESLKENLFIGIKAIKNYFFVKTSYPNGWSSFMPILMKYSIFIASITLIISVIKSYKTYLTIKKFAVDCLMHILLLIMVFIIAVIGIYLLSFDFVHILMPLVFVAVPLFITLTIDNLQIKNRVVVILRNISGLTIVLYIFVNILSANITFLHQEIAFYSGYAYFTNLQDDISKIDGYNTEIGVIFIGQPNLRKNEIIVPQLFSATVNSMADIYSSNGFMEIYGYLPNDVLNYCITENQFCYAETMPTYPNKGSIEIVDGYIIVKCG